MNQELASVHPDAQIGEGVTISPFERQDERKLILDS